ncbi:hypothetical protein AAC387_Pa06g0481 [Persea americana]
MSGGGRRNKGSASNKNKDSEVEELLRAAEDDMLLNLSINSHTSRSNPFDADLARRFEALKLPKPSSSSNITKSPKPNKEEEEERQVTTGSISSLQVDENLKTILGSDLSARFAALRKGSSSSSSSILSKDFQGHSGKSNDYDDDGDEDDDDEVDGDGVSKKEVDKLIQWAMDAARLDPSISSDDDVGGGDDDSDIDEEEEEEDKKKKKKKKKKGGIKKKKE